MAGCAGAALRQAYGTDLQREIPCSMLRSPYFAIPKFRSRDVFIAFYSTCVAAAWHGAGEWAFDTINVPGTSYLGVEQTQTCSLLAKEIE